MKCLMSEFTFQTYAVEGVLLGISGENFCSLVASVLMSMGCVNFRH